MVSLTDVTNWFVNRKDDVVNDINRGYSASKEAVTTGSADNLTMTRRDFGKGLVGATVLGAYGDDAAGAAGDAAGTAWHKAGEASPFDVQSPIVWKGGQAENDNTPTPTPTSDQGGGSGTPTSTAEPTATESPETTTPTETTTEYQTTATPDLSYDSISAALETEESRTQQGFQGYSLTALDDQLEGVGLEEAVENTGDYEAAIRDALEGTNYEDGVFELGEYGRGVDLEDDLGADNLDDYFEELEQEEELEDQMFGYFETLERV